jgi:hypothetical protein
MPGPRTVRSVALAAVALTIVASCSSDDGGTTAGGTTSTTAAAFEGRAPTDIASPPAEGKGVNEPQPSPALPDGYVEEEYLVGGTATSFTGDTTRTDGKWVAKPTDEAAYRSRVVVRRPASAEKFSGTVLVEWFNVSALESAPDWAFLRDEIGREGDAYIGVSAQAQGVEGGRTLLDVQVDPNQAGDLGADVDKSGLKNIDPARYGTLKHPGDKYAFDIFDQVGRAVRESPDKLLGGLAPKKVIAAGESQSAAFLTTLVNAVHPIDPVFDGFLIHSRGATGVPLDGNLARDRANRDVEGAMRRGVHIRTDLDVPVFMFETETDLTLLGYASARQPDTAKVHTWEVAGTSHADAHLLRSVIGGPRDPSVGSLIGCDGPINTGPQHEVLQAAFRHLVAWVVDGTTPPTGERLTLAGGDKVAIRRGEHGIAIGGVRTPLVDTPVATVTGDPPGGATIEDLVNGKGGICTLFGQTIAFDEATLTDLYGTADDYVAAFRASADETVAAGFLLRPDADALVAEAEQNRALFG